MPIKKLIGFAFDSIYPIIFLIINHFFGIYKAILVITTLVILNLIYSKINHKKINSLQKLFFSITIIFGFIDLLFLENPVFIRYESSLNNFIVAIYFLSNVKKENNIIEKIALDSKVEITDEKKKYFLFLSKIWFLYMTIKALIYFVMAFKDFKIEQILIFRIIFGKITFLLMILFSFYGFKIWKIFKKN